MKALLCKLPLAGLLVLVGWMFVACFGSDKYFEPIPPVVEKPPCAAPQDSLSSDTSNAPCVACPGKGNYIEDNLLPIPLFSSEQEKQAYGTIIQLKADSLPTDALYEYSWDSGKSWIQNDSIFLCQSGNIQARIRRNNTISRIASIHFTLFYQRVLIVGNSIMSHGPYPQIGWKGDWGMAASRPDSDFVHLLTRKLQQANPTIQIKLFNGVSFEKNYKTYDFTQADEYVDFMPDLIIMRIAENAEAAIESEFQEKYSALIKRLLSKSKATVLCTTSFWPGRDQANQAIKNVAAKNNYRLVDISQYFEDKSYTAKGLFEDQGVAAHPGDKGMRAIYESIAKQIP
ncbi:hypothetical protein GCM10027275_01640 [Rhabdobacter roseus]|uniref:SGNH/GDSL hydrolase family protein n=1 Tax=Rhabdobacter roseus TaxID=1655419 RepID=A0A840TPV8_9BACT|nr:SGNH/GDSL hydrolase family protein [Rhabdobacter roseus]MBB5282048.1 hypothetical protein [Rhabdobacter roseus]